MKYVYIVHVRSHSYEYLGGIFTSRKAAVKFSNGRPEAHIERYAIGPHDCVLKTSAYATINLITGEILQTSVDFTPVRVPVEQQEGSGDRRWYEGDKLVYDATSYVSEEHAIELAKKFRQDWLTATQQQP